MTTECTSGVRRAVPGEGARRWSFGYVAVCKDPQLYIDKLFREHPGGMRCRPPSGGTSPQQHGHQRGGVPGLEQARRPCGGRELDDRRLKEIVTQPLSDIYVQVAQLKIEEMKGHLQQPGREQRQRRVRRDCCCGHRCPPGGGQQDQPGHDLRQLPGGRQKSTPCPLSA